MPSFRGMYRSQMTLDSRQRISTALISVLIVGLVITTLGAGSRPGVGVLTFVLASLGVSWAMAPRALVVTAGEIRIERRAWAPLRISLASVASASPIDSLGPGTIRLFGVGGYFGSYGLFRSARLGRFRLYATHSRQAVLVRRTGDELPVVITPDDVAGAIGAIDRRPTEA
jgi:hypothetical protein